MKSITSNSPPFGFFSGTYLGEIAICVPLFDPEPRIDALKRRVAVYPDALRRKLVQDYLWMAEFGLGAFAGKSAACGETYVTVACLTSVVNQIVIALFALNEKYLLNDKTALEELTEFERAPRDFSRRVRMTLAHVGDSPEELVASVAKIVQLFLESAELAEDFYQSRYTSLPK